MSNDRRPLRPLSEGGAVPRGAAPRGAVAPRGGASPRGSALRDGAAPRGGSAGQGADSGGARTQSSADNRSLRITRRRIPELAIGVVLLGLGAIGAMLLSGDPPAKTPVLVWAEEVVRGQKVSGENLGIVEIDTDVSVDVVSASKAAEIVGKRALFRGNAGAFVSRAMLSEGPGLRDEEAVVGMRVGPGQYPSSTLSAGDVVDLVLPELRPGWDDPLVAAGVQVFEVEWLGDSGGGDALVSLLIPRGLATRVVEATIAGVRLVEVSL